MILHLNDIMDEVYERFDQIDEKALDKIAKHGLVKLRQHLKNDNELIVVGPGRKEMKFFIPLTPEDQNEHTSYKLWRKKLADEKANSK